jgi:hypothetical protein
MSRVALLLLLTAPLVAAPVPKGLKKKHTLDGSWEVVQVYNLGKLSPQGGAVSVFTIKGETLHIDYVHPTQEFVGARQSEYGLSLMQPEESCPDGIDYGYTYKDQPPLRLKGRYELLDEDTFLLCYAWKEGTERPAKCVPADDNMYYVLRRCDPTKLKAAVK